MALNEEVEDAIIIEETKANPEEPAKVTEEVSVDSNNVGSEEGNTTNVEAEASPPPEQDIKLTGDKLPEDATTTVKHKKKSTLKDFVAQQTKSASKKSESSEDGDKPTIEEIEAQLDEEPEKFTYEDLELFAEIAIDMIELGTVSFFRWYAKDKSDRAYEFTASKKSKLTKQLTRILVKYQTKLSLEFLFIITLVLCCVTPFRKAREHRRKVLAENATVDTKATVVEDKPKKTRKKRTAKKKPEEEVSDDNITVDEPTPKKTIDFGGGKQQGGVSK